jgi:hypothetical protein
MYTRDSLIMSQGVLTADDMADRVRGVDNPPNAGDFITLGQHTGVNHDIMFCQMWLETAGFTADYWTNRNNPGGIGATDDNPDGALFFPTKTDGLIAHFAHMLTYTRGDANPLASHDPRFKLVQHRGDIRTIGQLGNGVWATDPGYAGKIVFLLNTTLRRYNRDTGDGGGSVVPAPAQPGSQGGATMVPDQSYSLPVRTELRNNGKSWVDRPTNPDGRILAIVKHVTGGEDLGGALSWNRSGINRDGSPVQASAHFYIDKDGTVVQDVSLYNGAYANGVLANPTLPPQFDEVLANRWNPNDFTISIEHVGTPFADDFPTDAELTADARLTADLCDHFQIPVDTDHIIGHYRFDAVDRPNCPGPHWDFDADVRRVSYLLNGPDTGQGGTPDATTTQPAPKPDGNGNTGSNTPTAPTDTGSSGRGAGVPPVAGNPDDGGTQPDHGDGGSTDASDGWQPFPGTNGVQYRDHTDDGDGRGFTVRYPGSPVAGYRVGHGFYDEYTGGESGTAGLERGERLYGTARTNEHAAVVPGYGDQPVTIQVFDRAVFVWGPGMDAPDTMLSGILAARWLQHIGVLMPADITWNG